MIFGKVLSQGEIEKRIEDLDREIQKNEAALEQENDLLAQAVLEDSLHGTNKAAKIESKIADIAAVLSSKRKAFPKVRAALEREVRSIGRDGDKKRKEKTLRDAESWFKAATKRRAQLYAAAKVFVKVFEDYKLKAFDAPSGTVVSSTYDIFAPFRTLRADTFVKNFMDAFAKEARDREGIAKTVGQGRAAIEQDKAAFDQYSKEAVRALQVEINKIDSETASDPDPLTQVAG